MVSATTIALDRARLSPPRCINGYHKAGRGYYFMYVFKLNKVIGICPWGYPKREICIYHSWKEAYGDRFQIISVCPFSRAYHFYLERRKQGMLFSNPRYLFL